MNFFAKIKSILNWVAIGLLSLLKFIIRWRKRKGLQQVVKDIDLDKDGDPDVTIIIH